MSYLPAIPGPTGPAGAASTVPGPVGPTGPAGVYTPPTPRLITSGSVVTVAPSDGLIEINKATGSPTTVNFEPNPIPGTVHRVKDGKGDSATNPITINPASGTIDGASNYVINVAKTSISFEYNTVEWALV